MKSGLPALWAKDAVDLRREPTSPELADGFPCGPADQHLFNELVYRLSQMNAELVQLIVGAGLSPSELSNSQVYDAVIALITAATSGLVGGGGGGIALVATESPITGAGILGNPVKIDDATTSGKGAIRMASSANYLGNTSGRALTPDAVWDAADFKTITYAAAWSPDFSVGFNQSMALTGNVTMNNPVSGSIRSGQTGAIKLAQDIFGGRTLTFPSDKVFYFPGGFPGLSTMANAVDLLVYKAITPTYIVCALLKGMA